MTYGVVRKDPVLDTLWNKSRLLEPSRGLLESCWVWTGALDTKGYGRAWLDGRGQAVHRVAYERSKGPLIPGLKVDHLCRNRACWNPGHLEQVSNQENVRRGFEFLVK